MSTICPLLMDSPCAAEYQRVGDRQQKSSSEQRSCVTRTSCKSHVNQMVLKIGKKMTQNYQSSTQKIFPCQTTIPYYACTVIYLMICVTCCPLPNSLLISLLVISHHQGLPLPALSLFALRFSATAPIFKSKLTESS